MSVLCYFYGGKYNLINLITLFVVISAKLSQPNSVPLFTPSPSTHTHTPPLIWSATKVTRIDFLFYQLYIYSPRRQPILAAKIFVAAATGLCQPGVGVLNGVMWIGKVWGNFWLGIWKGRVRIEMVSMFLVQF